MKLAASVLAADPLRMEAALAAVEPHVGSWHVDVMDGAFAPAFGFGTAMVSALVARASRPVDVHLMVERPDVWGPRFAGLGVRSVAFHLETEVDALAVARDIRRRGAMAYAALRPQTAIEALRPLLGSIDGCLLLTAPAGGGDVDLQALEKVFGVPADLLTTVDGGLDDRHVDRLRSADVTDMVVGRSLFGAPHPGRRAALLFRRIAEASAGEVRRRHVQGAARDGENPGAS